MKYLVSSFLQPHTRTIEAGRELIRNGHHDPAIYFCLIKASRLGKYTDEAEDLEVEARKRFPQFKANDFPFSDDLKAA